MINVDAENYQKNYEGLILMSTDVQQLAHEKPNDKRRVLQFY